MTEYAKVKYDKLPPQAKRVVDSLLECKMEDLEALAEIMAPRLEATVYEGMLDVAGFAAFALLQDLQGRP